MKTIRLFPSLLNFDKDTVRSIVARLDGHCDGYHIDCMDGSFVPRVAGGPDFVQEVFATTAMKQNWLHLMVADPIDYLAKLTVPAGTMVSFHIETSATCEVVIDFIKEKNMSASLAISPKTGLEEIFPFLNIVDQVLLMSVEPGASGQPFILATLDKIVQLSALRFQMGASFRIAVDGGVTKNNIRLLAQIGVNDFALSSAIFQDDNPVANLKVMHEKVF